MGNTADLQLSTEGPVPRVGPGRVGRRHRHPGPQLGARAQRRPGGLPDDADQRRPHPARAALRMSVQDAEGAIGSAVERLVDLESRPDDGARRPRPGAGPGRDAAGRGAPRRAWVRVELEADGRVLVQRRVAGVTCWRPPSGWPLRCPWRWSCSPPTCSPTTPPSRRCWPRRRSCSSRAPATARSRVRRRRRAGRRGRRGDHLGDAPAGDPLQPSRPASWSDLGQQVRTPGEVLDGRVGTPLDTVVILAAALERAGIRPLLWIVSGGTRVRARVPRLLARGAQRGDRRHHRRRRPGRAGRPGRDRAGRDDAAHRPRRHPHRPARPGLRRLAVRRPPGSSASPTCTAPARTASCRCPRTPATPPASSRRPSACRRTPGPRAAGAAAPPGAPARVQQWKNALLDLGPGNPLIDYTRARRPAADRAARRAGAAGGPGRQRDADHPAAGRRRTLARARPARGAARRRRWSSAARCTPTSPPAALTSRLPGAHRGRGDRRQQPLPRAGQPGVGARRPPAALAAGADARRPHRRPASRSYRLTARRGRRRRTPN